MTDVALRLGDVAPDFEADSTTGKVSFHNWVGSSWAVLFSHPADYTPGARRVCLATVIVNALPLALVLALAFPSAKIQVCTTELGMVGKLQPEFAKRNVKTIAISVDPVDSHYGWVKDIEETQQTSVSFPIIADPDKSISRKYGMLAPQSDAPKTTVRSVFVIDPAKKVLSMPIRLTITYPASTGRNFDEILRVIDSLQLTTDRGVATPANWKKGDDVVILPTVSNEDAQKKFPGFKTIKPYLRTISLQ